MALITYTPRAKSTHGIAPDNKLISILNDLADFLMIVKETSKICENIHDLILAARTPFEFPSGFSLADKRPWYLHKNIGLLISVRLLFEHSFRGGFACRSDVEQRQGAVSLSDREHAQDFARTAQVLHPGIHAEDQHSAGCRGKTSSTYRTHYWRELCAAGTGNILG